MLDYTKYCCPVCNRQFEENDDIVTCPECGTPHHRECYNLTGHCVNKGLHEVEYSFMQEQKDNEENENIVEQAKKERLLNTLISDDDDNEAKPFSPFFAPNEQDTKYENDKRTIDGYDVADIAATVRSNAEKFIKKFSKKSKIGWNWGGFFFGSLYLLFRKMYKQGALFFACTLSTLFISNTIMMKLTPDTYNAMQGFYESYYQGGFSSSEAIQNEIIKIMQLPDATKMQSIAYVTFGVFFLIRLIIAIFGDNMYKNTVFDIIKTVGEKLDEGASFTATPVFMAQQSELNQTQMRRMYLASKGGVSFFAPMLALLAMQLIEYIV